ncbi:diguanylate cyclase [Stappia sp. ES.058]|uniref:sensor domain-containing diguanylate cyclase n=1 Tax=Stappia sp. ES.058 TaxID=1881061 RepID=UPI00087A3EDE|nr:diguanylate cyclase [Stappia sp. ES.058]SDU01608.1 PAS domain S-box-containing protein/diguanylate cyclase (GGDEF) domain-containing protein [Stappia sp. ES.058]
MAFLPEDQKSLTSLVDAIGASVAIYSADARDNFFIMAANRPFAAMLDRDADTLAGVRLSDAFPRYLIRSLSERITECLSTQRTTETEVVIDRGGRVSWWRFVYSPILSEEAATQRVLNTCIDITEKKSLETSLSQSRSRFEAVVEAAYDGIISVDRDHRIVLFNSAACQIFKIEMEDAIGRPLETLIPSRFRKEHGRYLDGFSHSPINSRPMESRVAVMGLRADGTEFPAEVTIAKIKVGDEVEYTAVVRDISERAKLIEELQRAAVKDPLTGVYNRRQLSKILREEVERCRRFDHLMTVAMIDLNGFKDINDTHGHHIGDEVLTSFTRCVQANLRDVDTLGRWGGDEFMIIWPETGEQNAVKSVKRIRTALAEVARSLSVPGVSIHFSIGLQETDGLIEAEDMILRADKLLYQEKRARRLKPA